MKSEYFVTRLQQKDTNPRLSWEKEIGVKEHLQLPYSTYTSNCGVTLKCLSGIKEAPQQLHEVAYYIHFTDGLEWESMKFKCHGHMRNHWQSWEQNLSPATASKYWQEQTF